MKIFSPLYAHLVASFGIPKPAPYVISSDVLLLSAFLIETGIKPAVVGELILNTLNSWLESAGATILIPAFNWDFCIGKDFDIYQTPGRTGALARIAKKIGYKRTFHPIYSFYVKGPHMDLLLSNRSMDGLGMESCFGDVYKNRGFNLFIGKGFGEMFTFVHLAEIIAKVDYRYYKVFHANYTGHGFETEKLGFIHYVRDVEKCSSTGISPEYQIALEQDSYLITTSFNDINIQLINIKESVDMASIDVANSRKYVFPVNPKYPNARRSLAALS